MDGSTVGISSQIYKIKALSNCNEKDLFITCLLEQTSSLILVTVTLTGETVTAL
jgi:hypothetical protein